MTSLTPLLNPPAAPPSPPPPAGPLHLDRTPGVADQVPAEERINATAAAVTAAAGTGKVAAPPAAKLGRSVFADPNLE